MKLSSCLLPTRSLLLLVVPTAVQSRHKSAFKDEQVTIYNTIEDAGFTGGAEAMFEASGPATIDTKKGAIEFEGFPSNAYDIDIYKNKLTYTLKDNSIASDLILPDGRFDRYYIIFSETVVDEIELYKDAALNEFASVRALPPGYVADHLVDPFGTGIPIPFTAPYGGIYVQIGPGSDLTNEGVQLEAKFDVSKMSSMMDVTVWNTFEDSVLTGGVESIFDTEGPVGVIEDVEFVGFPSDLYDIDVDDDGKITMTLIDNAVAADLLLPEGRFDRYYLDIGEVEFVELKGTGELNAHAQVTTLPPGYVGDVADLFGTGLATPFEVTNGGILIELGGGTDLSVLGVQLKAEFKIMGKGGKKGSKKGGKKGMSRRRATRRGL